MQKRKRENAQATLVMWNEKYESVMNTLAPGENPLKEAKQRSLKADCQFISRVHKSNYTVVEITTCEALNKIINPHSCCCLWRAVAALVIHPLAYFVPFLVNKIVLAYIYSITFGPNCLTGQKEITIIDNNSLVWWNELGSQESCRFSPPGFFF